MSYLSLAVRLLTGEPAGAHVCKFHPTCSRYARDAVHKHGVTRGLAKSAWRVLRCNPWSHGGVDPA